MSTVNRRGPAQTDQQMVTGSVVIPAHNEAAVIGRCLEALEPALLGNEIEIIVVANGCTDGTAAVARAAAPEARVFEIAEASKPAALRLGDSVATRMPRLYLDADVVMSADALRATLAVLAAGAVAARPPIQYDTDGSTHLVKRYYRARSALPSMHQHAWGAGAYGLSAGGRSRFSAFPDVVGDDLWIDNLLHAGELVVVATEPVRVRTPVDVRSVLRILRRAQWAKRESEGARSGRIDTEAAVARDLRQLARTRPLDGMVYAAFALAARLSASRRPPRWERDESSRRIA